MSSLYTPSKSCKTFRIKAKSFWHLIHNDCYAVYILNIKKIDTYSWLLGEREEYPATIAKGKTCKACILRSLQLGCYLNVDFEYSAENSRMNVLVFESMLTFYYWFWKNTKNPRSSSEKQSWSKRHLWSFGQNTWALTRASALCSWLACWLLHGEFTWLWCSQVLLQLLISTVSIV